MPADTLTTHLDAFKEAALSCPIPAAVELIGEKWAFLILRGALNGLHHFEEFQGGLGIARNILSDRLGKMVAGGILERSPDPSDRRRVIYSLTAKGEGPAAGGAGDAAVGRRMGLRQDEGRARRPAATASRSRRSASRPMTAAS